MSNIFIYVNGQALKNPGAAGCGVILVEGDNVKEHYSPIGRATNNKAELEAAIFGLKQLDKASDVTIISCSQWLVNCGNGNWQKNKYPERWVKVLSLQGIHHVRFEWVRKGTNDYLARATALANEAANESAVSLGSES